MNLAAAEIDDTQPVAPMNPAIAMTDEGNALEEQGRIPEAVALYEAAIQTDLCRLVSVPVFASGIELEDAWGAGASGLNEITE